jgi:hypothetical protein
VPLRSFTSCAFDHGAVRSYTAPARSFAAPVRPFTAVTAHPRKDSDRSVSLHTAIAPRRERIVTRASLAFIRVRECAIIGAATAPEGTPRIIERPGVVSTSGARWTPKYPGRSRPIARRNRSVVKRAVNKPVSRLLLTVDLITFVCVRTTYGTIQLRSAAAHRQTSDKHDSAHPTRHASADHTRAHQARYSPSLRCMCQAYLSPCSTWFRMGSPRCCCTP